MCRAPGPGFEAVALGGAKGGAQWPLAPGLVLFVRAFINYFRNGFFWTNNVECVYYEVRSDAGTRQLMLLSAV